MKVNDDFMKKKLTREECNVNEFDQFLGFERKVLDYKKFSDMEDK